MGIFGNGYSIPVSVTRYSVLDGLHQRAQINKTLIKCESVGYIVFPCWLRFNAFSLSICFFSSFFANRFFRMYDDNVKQENMTNIGWKAANICTHSGMQKGRNVLQKILDDYPSLQCSSCVRFGLKLHFKVGDTRYSYSGDDDDVGEEKYIYEKMTCCSHVCFARNRYAFTPRQ